MDLNINFEQLMGVASQVSLKGSEFQELLNKIKDVNNNLQAAWQGTDATKYTNAVATQSVEMQKLAETISEIGRFLNQVASKYQEVMEANSSAING